MPRWTKEVREQAEHLYEEAVGLKYPSQPWPPSQRIERGEMFLQIAALIAQRGTCLRLSVGAIAVLGDRICSMGYVGAPSGQPHCLEVGCLVIENHCIRTVHAEANVISWAANEGISLADSVLYTTHAPCLGCSKLIVNAGFAAVVYREDYGDGSGIQLLHDLEVEVEKYAA